VKVGILGAGQLGRMLAAASLNLGLEPHLYDPDAGACGHRAGRCWPFSYTDQDSLERFAREVDLCTFEFENVPVEAVQIVSRHTHLSPGTAAMAVSQDRLHEKNFLRTLGIHTPDFKPYDPGQELPEQGILKTRRLGYDGKGQLDLALVKNPWREIGQQPCLWEEKLKFQRELSQIGVRSRSGEIQFYPLVETIQRDGILCEAIAPARDSQALQPQAQIWVRAILEGLDYVGVLALELFEVDGKLLANEMAPRVHNSGHWTDRGCTTSQFENHWRALLDLPLGNTEMLGSSRLLNLLGELPEMAAPRAGVFPTIYGKEARKGRKLGHITLLAPTEGEVDELARQPWQSGVVTHGS